MDFAFNLPLAKFLPSPAQSSMDLIRTLASALEEAGFSAALMSEHPAPSATWLRNDPTAHDCLDSLTGLAFVAAATSRLRVFTNVLVLPYRNPFLTAKAAATVQILSDDRLILGVGTGYQKEEFDALGVPFAERGRLMDEALEVIRLAWQGGEVVKQGRYFNAVGNEPRPVPPTPPPIWIGGGSDKAVDRAARSGDGWAPYFTVPTSDPMVRRSAVVSVEHFGEKIDRLKEARATAGRDGRFDIAVSPRFRPAEASRANAERFVDEALELKDRGATWIWTSLPCASAEAYLDLIHWFGGEVIARCRA